MITITNLHSDFICMDFNNQFIKLSAYESRTLDSNHLSPVVYFNLLHDVCFWGVPSTRKEQILSSFANRIVLIVDTKYALSELVGDVTIYISNDVVDIRPDFGYVTYKVQANNCVCSLISCRAINQKQVLNTRKAICLGDSFEFFPFTIFTAINHYFKIKKLCREDYILSVLKNITGGG